METEGTIMRCFDESIDKRFAHQEPSKSYCSEDSSADARPSVPCFDCSICLDSAVDPVITLCGHLYCWPCIYKWLQVETTSPQQCPVCKSPLSLNALIPLYGRGGHSSLTAKSKGLNIPNRPVVLRDVIASIIDEQHSANINNDEYIGLHQQQPMQPQQVQRHHYYPSPWGGMGIFNSTAGGVLGSLAIAILPLVSRTNQGGQMNFSRYTYLTTSGSSVSQRMQERRVENSLHQIWIFLFCCTILGLLFF